MSMPVISVVVPVYNTECFLRECIESVLNQTYTNFELILIDDGSTDGSGAICVEYAQKDRRIRVFRQNNSGVSSARNKGIVESAGKYICFIDSDDFISVNYFEYLYSLLKKYNADISVVLPYKFSNYDNEFFF